MGNTPRFHLVSGTLGCSDCDHMFMLYILPLLVTIIDGVRASVRVIPYMCSVVQLRSFFKAVAMLYARNLTRGVIREKKKYINKSCIFRYIREHIKGKGGG